MVERIHKIISEEMSGLEIIGPRLMNTLIEEKDNRYIVKFGKNNVKEGDEIRKILHKTRRLQVKLSDDIEFMKEMRDSSMGADDASTRLELQETKRIEEEWRMREHDIIYGRSMDYEPWCICTMTIIKRRLSELIVNVNNLTKAAEMHMNDIM